MDMLLLGITIVSLIVAFVMSAATWRLMRDERRREAARVAALSAAAEAASPAIGARVGPAMKAPWSPPPLPHDPVLTHATGFLGAAETPRDSSSRQRSLALAAVLLFLVLSGGLAWKMSAPRGTTAQAVGPNAPLELVSLTHERHDDKLAVSGLVRNPVNGKPIDRLSAVVFLFDRAGTFVTSSRAAVDFLNLGAGDESPFVVSLDAPATVTRYRVSFRTDEGIVPHVDRRSATAAPTPGEQPVNVTLKQGSGIRDQGPGIGDQGSGK